MRELRHATSRAALRRPPPAAPSCAEMPPVRQDQDDAQPSEVIAALNACRPALTGVAIFSACINVLSLSGSLYMLQISDRVLSSRSIATLVGLSLLVLA